MNEITATSTIDDLVIKNTDGSITYKLVYPVQSEGSTLATVTVRRLKGGDLAAVDAITGTHSRNVAILTRLADLPAPTIRNLDGFDYNNLSVFVNDFLTTRPEIGAPSVSASPVSSTSAGTPS